MIELGVDRIRQQPTVEHRVRARRCRDRDPGHGRVAAIQLAQSCEARRLNFYKSPPPTPGSTRISTLAVTAAPSWTVLAWRGDRSRPGRSGGRPTRPRRTGTRPRTSSAWSPPTSPTTPTAAAMRTVRELVAEFRGLTRHGQAEGGARRDRAGAGAADRARQRQRPRPRRGRRPARGDAAPLQAGQAAALGIIGRDHFAARFAASGCEMESFDYRRVMDTTDDGVPWVVETAFGWCPRARASGCWSPASTGRPASSIPFRELGRLRREPRHDPEPAARRPGRAGDPGRCTWPARASSTPTAASRRWCRRHEGATRSSPPSRRHRRSGRSSARPRSATPRAEANRRYAMTRQPARSRSARPPSASWTRPT